MADAGATTRPRGCPRSPARRTRHADAPRPAVHDDPDVERDRKRWKVQQQAALALTRIYSESAHCGRVYCDGDPPERIANIKNGWLRVMAVKVELRALSGKELIDHFKRANPYERPALAPLLAAKRDPDTIRELEPSLLSEDRHMRGSAALVLGLLGDPRGFDTIAGVLADRSPRPPGVIGGGNWTLRAQIRADRYHAAHLLGDLKDPRGVDLLIPLLNDDDVADIVPWSLAEIGDRRVIGALIGQLTIDERDRGRDRGASGIVGPWRHGNGHSSFALQRPHSEVARSTQDGENMKPSPFWALVAIAKAKAPLTSRQLAAAIGLDYRKNFNKREAKYARKLAPFIVREKLASTNGRPVLHWSLADQWKRHTPAQLLRAYVAARLTNTSAYNRVETTVVRA